MSLADSSASGCRPFGISPACFAGLGMIQVIAVVTGAVTPGMIGVLPLLMIFGAVLDLVGNHTPIVRSFLGGGPMVVIFGAAAAATYLPGGEPTAALVTTFMKQGGFLDFYIAALITGSILGMRRRFLLAAAWRYLPVIMGGVSMALLAVGVVGALVGFGFMAAVNMIGIPIMGGGMGAGAIPISQIMAKAMGVDPTEMLSKMVPAVALANALAIVAAGCLDRLGSRFPAITGRGELMKRGEVELDEGSRSGGGDVIELGRGLVVAGSFFALGKLLALWVPVHPYALMIVLVAALKGGGWVGEKYEQAAAMWFQFVMRNLTHALLFGIGVAFTDLSAVIGALTPAYLAMVAATVVGAIIGAGAAGHMVGFYMVEASITGGLCMANMGGTGDVAVLSAAKRMPLMPFAQISSRLGGAFIILLVSLLVGLVGA